MNRFDNQMLAAAGMMDYPLRDLSDSSFQYQRQATYELFEADLRAKAARAESTPLVVWAKRTIESPFIRG